MKRIRILHRWMGIFFSPAILFFTLSGALQTFSLHDANRKTGYVPPTWLVEMAQLHKKQTLSLPKAKNTPVEAEPEQRDPAAHKKPAQPAESGLPLKCFVLVMSAGLFLTTLFGIYMAFCYGGDRRILWGLLAGGILLPILTIFL
jgi:hypothetical protein